MEEELIPMPSLKESGKETSFTSEIQDQLSPDIKSLYGRILEEAGTTSEPLKDRLDRLKQLKSDTTENEMLMKVAEDSQDYSMIPLLFEQHTAQQKEIDSIQKSLTIQLIGRFFQELNQNHVSIFEVTGFHAE